MVEMTASETDEALLRRYAAGEYAAFETLYLRHRASLFRFVLRQIDNQHAAAEEIFQETWSSVIKSHHQFQHQASFSVWLYQLARHRVIDFIRKNKLRAVELADEDVASVAQDCLSQEQQRLLEDCVELLKNILQQLPRDQHEAFLLKHEAEHTLERIAEITHSSRETIKSRLRYAMQKITAWMPEECL